MTTPTRLLGHYTDGVANPHTLPLLLGPSLGTTTALWDAAVPPLARTRQVVRWDLPGHGTTPTAVLPDPSPARTTLADLGALVIALADHLRIDRFAYAGVSLGGAVGGWLAVHHPERVASLTLICTSAHFGGPAAWHERAALVRDGASTGPVADTSGSRWFTAPFQTSPTAAALVAALRDDVDPAGYAACCDALAAMDLRGELDRVTAPTLVIAGRDDPATPPPHARELADGIAGADLLELSRASHLATVERPRAVTAALLAHLAEPAPEPAPEAAPDHPAPTDDAARRAAGLAVRRAVLGDAHVDRATARTTPLTADFQDFITRCAWGEIWTRPGLDRRTRSCVTLTALTAHGHHEELALHVRAAIRNGLTPDEIGEVLLQAGVYCGVPAANTAFRIAAEVLEEDPR